MSPTPAAWTTAAAATLRQEQKMTRPSPLQVLDADMPKWAAGGWKPGDAAGVLAALEEAGYVVVDRELDVERLAEACRVAYGGKPPGWMAAAADAYPDRAKAAFRNLADRIAAAYSKIAERSVPKAAPKAEAAEEVERG